MNAMRMEVSRICRELGLDVEEAHDGDEALRILCKSPETFSVVISDWTMPGLSGLDLLTKIRSDQRLSQIPFVMLTAESEPAQIRKAYQAKVTSYVRKPFRAEHLKDCVMKVVWGPKKAV